MKSRIWTVFAKECIDNMRDKRTLATALLFGPIFGPIMLVVMVNFVVSVALQDAEEALNLPVQGAEYAPNLIAFLEQHHTNIQSAPENPEQAVKDGKKNMVMVITADYAQAFKAGKPAPLTLIQDSTDKHARKHVRRAESLLQAYSSRMAALRLQARGVNALVMSPLALQEQDVASDEARGAMLLGMLPYFLIFSALMGGMYLAIDTTAGERERNSLEPLLSTPASRAELLLGKLGATALYSMLSLTVALLMLAATIPFVPLSKLGMASSMDVKTVIMMLLGTLPFAVLSAAMLSLVASFTKSYKEAQTWISVVMIIPIVPVMMNIFYPLQPSLGLMAIPIVSQNILLMEFLKGSSILTSHMLMSAATTLILAAILGWITIKLYEREIVTG